MGKTTVFFGAGAECGFGIGGGEHFARMVLGIETPEMNKAIKRFYSSKKYHEKNSWYPTYRIKNWEEKDLLTAAIKKSFLDEKKVFDRKKDFDVLVEKAAAELNAKERKQIINEHTSYMGLLDAHFHTLISPRSLGPIKFWNVVCCYTRAYLAIVSELLYGTAAKNFDSARYENILKTPSETILHLHEKCSTDERFTKKSYYSILQNYKDVTVVTSNYTPCCEVISKREPNQIAYVHGKIGLFESPYEWQIYDAANDDLPDDQLLFPYLFVQSGIKPIVEETQIQAFSKMLKYFGEADKIVIVGYRINADDNHLNGIIRKMILRDKQVVYLDYDNCSAETIEKRLRLNQQYPNFICCPINQGNCFEIFEKVISS